MTALLKETDAPPIKAYAAVSAVIFAAATVPIVIRYAQAEGLPSVYIIALRLWIAVIVLAPLARRSFSSVIPRLTRRDWGFILLAGTMHVSGLLFLFFSLEYTTVLVNSVIRRMSPLLIIILEILFLHAVFSKRVWLGVVLVIGGGIFVGFGGAGNISGGANPLLGGFLALSDAFVNSIYVLIGRSLRTKIPFLLYSWIIFLWAAIVSTVIVLILGIPLTGYSTVGYLWVIVIAVIAQLMGHLPLNAALRFFEATRVSIYMQISVVISALLALLLFSEIPTVLQIVGSVGMGAGVILANRRNR